MEKEELIISENQIEFDFDAIEKMQKQQEEEVSQILPQGFVISKNDDWIDNEVLFIVLKTDGAISYNIDLCGKKMIDWVLFAGSGCQTMTLADPKDDLLQVIKDINTDKKYIALFYSDTPLLEKATFRKIMDYFSKNKMNVLALPRGYVFKTDFIKNIEKLSSSRINEFDERAFLVVDSASAINKVSKYLYDKIRAFHIKNGVIMYGAGTIFIDADVEIEPGVIIEPNNIIRGQTYIGKGVVIEANNFISDSIIADNATTVASYIEKSKISAGVEVGPFEKIISSEK